MNKLRFKERLNKTFNLISDMLMNYEDYDGDKEIDNSLNNVNDILTELINKMEEIK